MALFRRSSPKPLVYLSPADVARRIERSPSRISRYLQAGAMPPADAEAAAGGPLWRPETIDLWWVDHRGPKDGPADDEGPRWLRPLPAAPIDPEVLEERIVDVTRPHGDGRATTAHMRVYRAVDGGGPVVTVESMDPWARGDLPLEPFKAVAATDLDDRATLWIRLRTWDDRHGDEWGGWPRLDVDLWIYRDRRSWSQPGGWTPADADDQPLTTAGLARLIGQPLPLYPRDLLTPETITASSKTPPTEPISVLTDPHGIAQSLAHLDAITTAPSYPHDPALRTAATVIATLTDQVDEQLTATRSYPPPPDRRPMPPGTRRGAVAVPRQLLPPERSLVSEYLVDDDERYRVDSYDTGRRATTISGRVLPTLRRLRRHYLNDVELPPALRDALDTAAAELADAYQTADPTGARREAPLLVRRHDYDPDHWLIRSYLSSEYEQVDHSDLPAILLRRADALADTHWKAEDPQWWIRRDWTSETDDDAEPDQPALAFTYSHTYGSTTDHSVHLEWPPLRTPERPDTPYASAHLVAPPSEPDVYRPVFIHSPRTGRLRPLPSDGEFGPAWGVSSTDQLTPKVLSWLGFREHTLRNQHPETHQRLRALLWGSGSADLDQPVAPILTALLSHGPALRAVDR